MRKALNVIHDSFFLSQTQVLNIFIAGVGHVGGNLLRQIKSQKQKLLEEKSLELRIVGVSSSKKCVFDAEGIDMEQYADLLEKSDIAPSPEVIKDMIISMNLFNSVFVDCTASADIASIYGELLSHNINVVAANKIAASSAYENYHRLKEISHR